MKTEKVNCINIAFIFKTSLGSINGSWTEGNVSTVKKITLPSGETLPYVSGQSLRYQIRRKFEELGCQLSPLSSSEKKSGVDVTAGDPEKWIDDDLFGFMIASSGENRRRTSAVRTSACVGLFPFKGDRDMGTKSKEQTEGDMAAGGNIFETEEYYNYFKENILIEVDRVGVFQPFELSKEKQESIGKEKLVMPVEERRERIKKLFEALKTLWGGGKQTRMLSDISPKFIIITFQTAKLPLFLEGFEMLDDETLNSALVKEILEDNSPIITEKFLGIRSGIFKNNLNAELSDYNLLTVNSAINNAINKLKNLEF